LSQDEIRIVRKIVMTFSALALLVSVSLFIATSRLLFGALLKKPKHSITGHFSRSALRVGHVYKLASMFMLTGFMFYTFLYFFVSLYSEKPF
jgi:hypothetical protein